MKELETDFAVVGSGLAGLQTAWWLASSGEVLLFTRSGMEAGNSFRAQGGIAAAVGDGDSPDLHRADTLRAGAGLCRPAAVDVLVRGGADAVDDLIGLGAPFDRVGEGWALGKEGSHSVARILHAAGDATGKVLVRTLWSQVEQHPRIHLLPWTRVTGLIAEEGECYGLTAVSGGHPVHCRARAVVLATGGCGQLFRYTTNDPAVTGDGLALASRAGATLADMELVQFHPTALAVEQNPMFLISEALRGEGAVLVNDRGEAFMSRYHDWEDLAPRDVVSRAIDREMRDGRRVYLDARGLKDRFATRFPTIDARCRAYGIQPGNELIPVIPAAHFLMGGVRTDLFGRTSLRRLFAVGEVACTGVHGANRLASNSLLEGAVFARRVAGAAASLPPPTRPAQRVVVPRMCNDEQKETAIIDDLRRIMWEHAGIIRNKEGLLTGLDALTRLRKRVPENGLSCHFMIEVSQMILKSALMREESRGGHYRSDFPEPQTRWTYRRIYIQRGEPVESVATANHGT